MMKPALILLSAVLFMATACDKKEVHPPVTDDETVIHVAENYLLSNVEAYVYYSDDEGNVLTESPIQLANGQDFSLIKPTGFNEEELNLTLFTKHQFGTNEPLLNYQFTTMSDLSSGEIYLNREPVNPDPHTFEIKILNPEGRDLSFESGAVLYTPFDMTEARGVFTETHRVSQERFDGYYALSLKSKYPELILVVREDGGQKLKYVHIGDVSSKGSYEFDFESLPDYEQKSLTIPHANGMFNGLASYYLTNEGRDYMLNFGIANFNTSAFDTELPVFNEDFSFVKRYMVNTSQGTYRHIEVSPDIEADFDQWYQQAYVVHSGDGHRVALELADVPKAAVVEWSYNGDVSENFTVNHAVMAAGEKDMVFVRPDIPESLLTQFPDLNTEFNGLYLKFMNFEGEVNSYQKFREAMYFTSECKPMSAYFDSFDSFEVNMALDDVSASQ